MWNGNIYSDTKIIKRTEKEIKLGVFKEDLKKIGKFKAIEYSPKGLFPENLKSFYSRSQKAQTEISRIFIKQKGLLEKYPDQMMLGMAYFEFFYMQQLKESKWTLERFENKYPSLQTKKNMQKIYNLNEARKTMREAIGLKIDDNPKKALDAFFSMYLLFNQAKTETIKLSKMEKEKIKINNNITKNLGSVRKITEKYHEQRLTKKEFQKKFKKNFKKLNNSLKKGEKFKEYELISSLIEEMPDLKEKNVSAAISGFRLAEFITKDLKKNS